MAEDLSKLSNAELSRRIKALANDKQRGRARREQLYDLRMERQKRQEVDPDDLNSVIKVGR